MTVLLTFALASALTLPAPANSPSNWAMDSDYPTGAKQRGEGGAVDYLIIISPEGRVSQCQITQSSGSAELDQRTCEVFYARAMFKPAMDENNNPTSGLYKGRFTWTPEGQQRKAPPRNPERRADIELQVNHLPNNAQEIRVGITARIDENGKIGFCEPFDDAGDNVKLARIACAQAKTLISSAMVDAAGKPIPMVRTFGVSFKASDE